MLRTIPIDQVTTEMFVTKIVNQSGKVKLSHGGWIHNEDMIQKMRSLGIKEVEIDDERQIADKTYRAEIGDKANQDPATDGAATKSFNAKQEKYSVTKCHKLYEEAKQIQNHLLHDIKAGKPIDASEVKQLTESFVDCIFVNADALVFMTSIREKDAYLFEHSVNVSILMSIFAKHLAIDKATINELATGAFLHDIGKVLVPNDILNKPGKLTAEEYDIMKQHVTLGLSVISKSPGIATNSTLIIEQHHERINGMGYPSQLAAEQIDKFGRMIAIVDVYDALTATRCYKAGMTSTMALDILVESSGWEYDKSLVESFIDCVGVYPLGTIVLLKSGKLGFVVRINPENHHKPVVRVFYNAKSRHHTEIKDVNLNQKSCSEQIVKAVDAEEYKINRREVFQRAVLQHE